MATEVKIAIRQDSGAENQTCPNCHQSHQEGLYIVCIIQDGMCWFDYGRERRCDSCGVRFVCARSYETLDMAKTACDELVNRLERFQTLGILMLVGRYPKPSLHLH